MKNMIHHDHRDIKLHNYFRRRKTEIHEIEERKNGQIHALMKNHEKQFR